MTMAKIENTIGGNCSHDDSDNDNKNSHEVKWKNWKSEKINVCWGENFDVSK